MDTSSSPHSFDLAELKEAFLLLASASKRMEHSYEQLRLQAEGLKRELRDKNARLLASLREKQRLESFLEGILEHLPVGILVTDRAGKIRLANQKAKEILGRGDDELVGQRYASIPILRGIPLKAGGSAERKKGRRAYRCSVSCLEGGAGGEGSWVILIEDTTAVTRWKALAERQKRLSSMGEMAARIAHEIRNPLGSMELNLSMLLEELEGDEILYGRACRLATALRTVTQILANLLHFAKGADPKWEWLELEGLIREALEFSGPLLRQKGIRTEVSCRARCRGILGDRILLRQALLNLILNAVESMDPEGVLRIRVEEQQEGSGLWNGTPVMKVLVQDDGKGIPDEDLDRIFDPFFTTKSRGTGLGLAIVNNIVESHGGIVEVESSVGQGSCFVVSLPCPQEEPHDRYPADPRGG